MLTDIWTIVSKEWKELLMQRGRMRSGLLGMLIFVGVFGIFMPITSGPEWLNSPVTLIIWAWLPFLLVGGVIADAIAGERERHTLETLLASRLPDRAILFGKIVAAVSYAWGLTILTLLLALVTVNIVHSKGNVQLYPVAIGIGALVFSLLVSLLAASVGILVSLRADSVKSAYQKLSISFMVVFMGFFILVQVIPNDWKLDLLQQLMTVNLTYIGFAVALFLVIIDIILLYIASVRFQRARLIID